MKNFLKKHSSNINKYGPIVLGVLGIAIAGDSLFERFSAKQTEVAENVRRDAGVIVDKNPPQLTQGPLKAVVSMPFSSLVEQHIENSPQDMKDLVRCIMQQADGGVKQDTQDSIQKIRNHIGPINIHPRISQPFNVNRTMFVHGEGVEKPMQVELSFKNPKATVPHPDFPGHVQGNPYVVIHNYENKGNHFGVDTHGDSYRQKDYDFDGKPDYQADFVKGRSTSTNHSGFGGDLDPQRFEADIKTALDFCKNNREKIALLQAK